MLESLGRAILDRFGASLGALWGPSWGHFGLSWGHLGPCWGQLGAILGHLGAILGHLGAILAILGPSFRKLGPFWVLFGAIFGLFGGQLLTERVIWPRWSLLGATLGLFALNFLASTSKVLCYQTVICFLSLLFGEVRPGGMRYGDLGPSSAAFAMTTPQTQHTGRLSWKLRSSWGHLGPSWSRLGAILEPSWGPRFQLSRPVCWFFGAVFIAFCLYGDLGPSSAAFAMTTPQTQHTGRLSWKLGSSWGHLGPSWSRLGAILEPSWGLRFQLSRPVC